MSKITDRLDEIIDNEVQIHIEEMRQIREYVVGLEADQEILIDRLQQCETDGADVLALIALGADAKVLEAMGWAYAGIFKEAEMRKFDPELETTR